MKDISKKESIGWQIDLGVPDAELIRRYCLSDKQLEKIKESLRNIRAEVQK